MKSKFLQRLGPSLAAGPLLLSSTVPLLGGPLASGIGREVAIQHHLADGDDSQASLQDLLRHGQLLFTANWTRQEGGGRPLTKGTGSPLTDPTEPLVFPRNFNRISAPDANSCAGCHNAPFGIAGGGGDVVANVFVLGQRFDFATFASGDEVPTKNATDERGRRVALQSIANSRATLGMFGSGYVEMLARQITQDLQAIRDATPAGSSRPLVSKGVDFGLIRREADGRWDVSGVTGLGAVSLEIGPDRQTPPSLILRPFHQAGRVVSLREFSNNAFNHHHGIQSIERFGAGTDPDGDGFTNELTRTDVTAAALFQATLAVPGRVIANDPEVEEAVLMGEVKFQEVGCAVCHVPSLALAGKGRFFTEPNPFNPPLNLRPGEAPEVAVDLTSNLLPPPRLSADAAEVVYVPLFSDLKLHDITSGPDDPNREPLDMQMPNGSEGFFLGNGKFLTRRLWDAGNKPNHYHHGQYTTLRETVLAHAGEASVSRSRYVALTAHEQDCVIEFLKSLQVLPPGTHALVVDEHYQPKTWPPNRLTSVLRRSDGTVSVSWQGGTGLGVTPRIYQLQRCTNLRTGDWTDIGRPTAETQFSELSQGEATFYRVVLLEP